MMLIWQELRAILVDLWGTVSSASRQVLTAIAENYQPLLVMAIGFPISAYLTIVPLLAALDSIVEPIRETFDVDSAAPAFRGGNGIAYLVMFFLGVGVGCLTIELTDRLFKRLEGKPKEDISDESGAA